MNYHIISYSILVIIIIALTVSLVIISTDSDDMVQKDECITDVFRTVSIIAEPTTMRVNLSNNEGVVLFRNDKQENIKLIYIKGMNNPYVSDGIGNYLYLKKNNSEGEKYSFVFLPDNGVEKGEIKAKAELIGDNGIRIYSRVGDVLYYLSNEDINPNNVSCPFTVKSRATSQPKMLTIL